MLKQNPVLSSEVDLHDTSVVIDSSNLCFTLYDIYNNSSRSDDFRNDMYGGDMPGFAQVVRDFFAKLDKCNITPILVLDGSVIGKEATKDEVLLKDQTCFNRAMERFRNTMNILEYDPSGSLISPLLMSRVYKLVARDMGIQIVQCPYEADTHIARISNELNCPVVTNDSDFFIYNLKVGHILAESLVDALPQEKQIRVGQAAVRKQIIRTRLINHHALVRCIKGLRPETLPLLGILLGNDFVERGAFDPLINEVCNVPYNGVLLCETHSHRKIANLLRWLAYKSLDEALEEIVSKVSRIHQGNLSHQVRRLLRNYDIAKSSDFLTELSEMYPDRDICGADHPELKPPAFLRRIIEDEDASSLALDLIFRNTHYFYSIVDDVKLPAANYVIYRPLSLAIVLVRPNSYGDVRAYQRQLQANKDAFNMGGRLQNRYMVFKVKPMETLENFGSLEHLDCYNMLLLEPALKKSLLHNLFRFTDEEFCLMTDLTSKIFTDCFVLESTICLLLVKYASVESKRRPVAQFVQAIILTLVFYAALDGKLNSETMEESKYGPLLLKIKPHTKNYIYIPKRPDSEGIFRRVVHFINELQACYQGFTLINSLLNHVYAKPRYDKFFNSVLMFRLTKLFRYRSLEFNSMCHELQVLIDFCGSICTMLQCTQ